MNEHHERRRAEINQVLTSGLQPTNSRVHLWGEDRFRWRSFPSYRGLRWGFDSLCAAGLVVMEKAG